MTKKIPTNAGAGTGRMNHYWLVVWNMTVIFFGMDYDFPYGNNMDYSGLMDFNGFSHMLGMSSSQLTNSYFSEG